jgi:HEPN domain-containing protein
MRRHEQALLLWSKACDDETLVDEVLTSPRVSDEMVGFHCQQAAEKFLKAVLSEMGVHFQRTHNLRQLMDLLSDAGQQLPDDLSDLDTLTPFGTIFRYDVVPPAHPFDRQRAREMIRRVREWAESEVQSVD